MFFELKRYIKNSFFLIPIGMVLLNFLLGYILLVTIDGLEVVTLAQLFESTYTVFTQFGMLIFAPLAISMFSVDYKEKNILFYKTLNIGAIQYFINKLTVLISFFAIGILVVTTIVSLLYSDFSLWLIMIFSFGSVTIAYISLIALWGFLFSNFTVAFFINFIIWIVSIMVSSISSKLFFIAYYDASTHVYKDLVGFLDKLPAKNYAALHITENIIYNLSIWVICLVTIFILKKRWYQNGI